MNQIIIKTKNVIAANKVLSLAIAIVIIFAIILIADNASAPATITLEDAPSNGAVLGPVNNGTSTTTSGTEIKKPSASKPVVIPKDTIYFDGVRFTPSVLKTKAGSTVTFANKSSKSMRIKYMETASGTPTYNEFFQERTVGKNGIYQFVFTKRGTWNYYNMNNVKAVGSVVVE